MLASARLRSGDFEIEYMKRIEEAWEKEGREIDPSARKDWISYTEHPRRVIIDAKNYKRIYMSREALGLDSKEIERKNDKKMKERMKAAGGEGRKTRYRKLKDRELNDSFEEIRRIEEKLEYLYKKKTDRSISSRRRKRFVELYEYLWQYRKAVRNAASRLKERDEDYEEYRKEVKDRMDAELNYIRRSKTAGERYVEQLKGMGAKLLVGLGAGLLSVPLTDKWPYWGAVAVTGTFLGHFAMRTYAWTAEDKAMRKYQDEIKELKKRRSEDKARIYIQTSLQALDELEDILGISTQKKTFADYAEEARRI
ncbi:MAG: hypothetical protein QXU82_02515 [Candidatus Aenigmatarchaeota archaeon]